MKEQMSILKYTLLSMTGAILLSAAATGNYWVLCFIMPGMWASNFIIVWLSTSLFSMLISIHYRTMETVLINVLIGILPVFVMTCSRLGCMLFIVIPVVVFIICAAKLYFSCLHRKKITEKRVLKYLHLVKNYTFLYSVLLLLPVLAIGLNYLSDKVYVVEVLA